MNLSPELLAQIQQAVKDGSLQLPASGGRSPIRPRQLHDLRLLPTKDDPRPTFFWSAVAPRDGVDLTRTTEFPKLLWHTDSGQEVTVISKEAQEAHLRMGYTLTAPAWQEPDPMEAIQAQWDALSADDQALLLESRKQDRIAMLKAKLSALPESKLAEMLSKAAQETPAQQEIRLRPRPAAEGQCGMSDYPRLLWGPQGQEVTVHSPAAEKLLTSQGFRLTQETFTLTEPVVPDEPEPEIPHRKGRR